MIEAVDGKRQLDDCKRIVVKIGSSLQICMMQGMKLSLYLPALWRKAWSA